MTVLNDIKKFALRGNLIDMAVGFTVGAAFTTIAKSLVSDIVMPPIGLLLGGSDFSDFFILLQAGDKIPPPYQSLQAAQDSGAITINYGLFINNIVAFLLVTIAMFFIIRVVSRLDKALDETLDTTPPEDSEPTEKKCQFCRSTVAYRATRCAFCTSELEGVER